MENFTVKKQNGNYIVTENITMKDINGNEVIVPQMMGEYNLAMLIAEKDRAEKYVEELSHILNIINENI